MARELEPLILAAEEELETHRRMPQELVDALYETGVFRAFTPAEVGGLEVDLLEWLELIEELSRLNGSVGWNDFIQAGQTALGPETMRRILAGGRYITAGAIGRAGGRAHPVDGGYRITGRWPFASGAPYATHLSGRALVYDAGENPVEDPQLGGQRQVIAVFPQADVTIHDTWDGLGLRGTQSVDFEVADVFVPEEFAGHMLTGPYPGPLFRGVYFILLGHSAHALGIARCAIDAFVELDAGEAGARLVPPAAARPAAGAQARGREGGVARPVGTALRLGCGPPRLGGGAAARGRARLPPARADGPVDDPQRAGSEGGGRADLRAGRDERRLPRHADRALLPRPAHGRAAHARRRGSYDTIGEYYLTRTLPDGPQIDTSITVVFGSPPG